MTRSVYEKTIEFGDPQRGVWASSLGKAETTILKALRAMMATGVGS